ncbi:hypothetical protein SSX86_033121, partial [Deinandra increscens subsp. villosa]
LYEHAIKYEKGSFITLSKALATLFGAKTGRAPKDKSVFRDDVTEDELCCLLCSESGVGFLAVRIWLLDSEEKLQHLPYYDRIRRSPGHIGQIPKKIIQPLPNYSNTVLCSRIALLMHNTNEDEDERC